MTDKELLREALDALEEYCEHNVMLRPIEKREALRARLSQPEPRPVAWGLQQQFEGKIGTAPVAFKRHDEFGFVVPLYAAPPQREWVGLTDEDIEDCLEMSIQGTCRAIEAKLKEKNT